MVTNELIRTEVSLVEGLEAMEAADMMGITAVAIEIHEDNQSRVDLLWNGEQPDDVAALDIGIATLRHIKKSNPDY